MDCACESTNYLRCSRHACKGCGSAGGEDCKAECPTPRKAIRPEPVVGTHRWEVAGLGKAPYRFLGTEDTNAAVDPQTGMRRLGTDKDGITHWTSPGGTCAFCGQCIFVLCKFRSADGQEFHVGQDCAQKSGDAGIVKAVAHAERKRQAAKRATKAAAVAVRLGTLLDTPSVRTLLGSLPHPHPVNASKGRTLLEWADFVRDYGGAQGKNFALLKILHAMGGA